MYDDNDSMPGWLLLMHSNTETHVRSWDVLGVKKYIFTVYNEEAKIVIHVFLHGAIQHWYISYKYYYYTFYS